MTKNKIKELLLLSRTERAVLTWLRNNPGSIVSWSFIHRCFWVDPAGFQVRETLIKRLHRKGYLKKYNAYSYILKK